MNLFTTMLIFYLCIAISLTAFGVATPANEFLTGTATFQDLIMQNALFLTITGGAMLAAVLAGGGFALHIVLAAIVVNALSVFFTYPTGLINSAAFPPEFLTLTTALVCLLQFVFTLAMVNYMRGDFY